MNCEHQFVAVEESKSVTFAGIFGVVLFLFGGAVCFANVIFGALIIVLAIIISMSGRKRTVIKCAKCGEISAA